MYLAFRNVYISFKYHIDLFTITALLLSKMIKFGKFKSVNNLMT